MANPLFLQPSCAAFDDNGQACTNTPLIPCHKCQLVSYCTESCLERHRDKHWGECPGIPTHEHVAQSNIPDQPVFEPTSFWSSCAATDVINLENNEGKYYDDDLNLLFIGGSGLRHLIYSVLKLPTTSDPRLDVTIIESDVSQYARTLFALLLLRDRDHDPILNAEAAVHLWYSARMPKALAEHINLVVGGAMKKDFGHLKRVYQDPQKRDSLFARVGWHAPNLTIRAELPFYGWHAMEDFLSPPPADLDSEIATTIRLLDLQKHSEPLERCRARMSRWRAAGMMKWRQDGLLLPYDHPRKDFDVLNPIFFHTEYPPGASSEPLSEWPMEMLDCKACPSPNDVYGKMFYYVRDLLVQFIHRSREVTLLIKINYQNTSILADYIWTNYGTEQFDRIELGSLWDSAPLRTLLTFCKLLRHEDENSFATMLIATRSSVTNPHSTLRKDLDAERLLLHNPSKTILDEYACPAKASDTEGLDVILRRQLGLLLWRNWDKFSDNYLHAPRFFDFLSLDYERPPEESRSVLLTGLLGITMKPKNTITRKWCNRLVYNKKDTPSLVDFDRWLGWPDTRPTRWLEWKRNNDCTKDEWKRWIAISHANRHLRLPVVETTTDKSTGKAAKTSKQGGAKVGNASFNGDNVGGGNDQLSDEAESNDDKGNKLEKPKKSKKGKTKNKGKK